MHVGFWLILIKLSIARHSGYLCANHMLIVGHVILSASCTPINPFPPSAAYMRQWTGSSLVQVMACRLFGAKPLTEPMLAYCQLDSWENISVKFESEFYHFYSMKCNWKCRLTKWQPFCPGGDGLKHMCGQVMPHTVITQDHHCFGQWFVACWVETYYLSQWKLIVNWSVRYRIIRNAHHIWWPTLEPLIWPQVLVEMGL